MSSLSDFWLVGSGLDTKPAKNTGAAKLIARPAFSGTGDEDEITAYTLAAVLNAAARVVGIVHGRQRFKVNFASEKTTTDLSSGIITLSAAPVLQPPASFSLVDSIDVITGMALHEAAHAQFSDAQFHNEIPGNPFIGAVRNLVEDVYVERLTTLLYPGYAGYFTKYRYYQYDLGKKHPPVIHGENDMQIELNSRTIELILMFRSTTGYKSARPRICKAASILENALSTTEFRYLRRVNVRNLALRVYNWLFGNIIQHDIAYVQPVDMLEQYNLENKADNNQKQTISENIQQMINSIRQEEVKIANQDELNEAVNLSRHAPPPVMVTFRKPVLTKEAPQLYAQSKSAVARYIIRLRNQMSWANTRQVINRYALPSGELDQDALYQVAFSNKIFSQAQILEMRTRKLDIALLIDCSSSMTAKVAQDKTRLELARDLAVLFVEALAEIDSVQTWVFGFNQTVSADITELYAPTLNIKSRLGTIQADGTTPEGSALKYCAAKLLTAGRRQVAKILIVLADGNPNPGREKKMVGEQARYLQNSGCKLIHIAISDQAMPYGYKYSIAWSDYYTVINQFGKMLKDLLE
ncbi:MAG: VWA domain-containing protein [Desulfotomaculum sp.]|nr:VWA domain-containing protein [Desulfotomaculum sp.]